MDDIFSVPSPYLSKVFDEPERQRKTWRISGTPQRMTFLIKTAFPITTG
jgi:hypothetical protein